MKAKNDPFDVLETMHCNGKTIDIHSLKRLENTGFSKIEKFPFSIKILLEAILRKIDGDQVKQSDLKAIANWDPQDKPSHEIPFTPARVLLQDFTGVPAVVDLAAMRSAMDRLGGDPNRINPLIPVDLVIDHSIQVDYFGSPNAQRLNEEKEFERNQERYTLLRWAQTAFDNFRVVPPGRGIVHQINLENLASVIQLQKTDDRVRKRYCHIT